MVLFLGIIRDSDVAALVSVVLSSCGRLWEVDRVFNMAEMRSGDSNSEKGGVGSMSALNMTCFLSLGLVRLDNMAMGIC